MARGCQACTTKVLARKSHIAKANPDSNTGFYCENTIIPGATPMEKGEPDTAVGTPVF
jgi:hypothetical protein